MKKRLLTLILALAFQTSIIFLPPIARAQEFIFVRPGDPDRIFKQNEALVIELPPNLNTQELSSLFLELNGIDITQRVTVEGARVVFYPASPYNAGANILRLVRMGKNGKLVEINRWRFNTAGGEPPVMTETSVDGTLDAAYSYRYWDNYNKNLSEPDVHNIETQGTLNATTQQGGWRLSLRGNGFANTDETITPSGDNVEVGEYLLRAENAGALLASSFSLGNHDIGASNFLIDQFYRRGLSGTFDYKQGFATLTGFMMNPAAATGNRNLFGLENENQRANGIYVTTQPFASLGDLLEVEATVYDGSGGTNGNGTDGISGSTIDAAGYQVGGKIQLVKDLLGSRIQYARTDADNNGLATSSRDEAYGINFTLTPLKNSTDEDGRILQWEIEPGYYRAGTYFTSLLNPSAENDREIWNIKNRYLNGNLSLDGEISWIQDNVNNLAGIPTDRSLQAYAQASWSPDEEMWGTPLFILGCTVSDDNRLKKPAGFTGSSLNRQTRSTNGGVVLSFDKTTWSLNHTYTILSDKADTIAEYNTNYSDIGIEYRYSDRLTFRPGLQVEILREDIDGTSTAVYGSVGIQAVIIPDKFWNNIHYSMLVNNGDTPQGRTYRAETEFNWLIKKADINSPGYAVSFSGYYDNETDTYDTTDREPEELRLFARLKLSATFSMR